MVTDKERRAVVATDLLGPKNVCLGHIAAATGTNRHAPAPLKASRHDVDDPRSRSRATGVEPGWTKLTLSHCHSSLPVSGSKPRMTPGAWMTSSCFRQHVPRSKA